MKRCQHDQLMIQKWSFPEIISSNLKFLPYLTALFNCLFYKCTLQKVAHEYKAGCRSDKLSLQKVEMEFDLFKLAPLMKLLANQINTAACVPCTPHESLCSLKMGLKVKQKGLPYLIKSWSESCNIGTLCQENYCIGLFLFSLLLNSN